MGRFLITGTPTGSVDVSSSGLHAVTADATLGAFSGTGTNGLTLGLNTGSNVFNGGVTQTANYTIGGTANTVGAISGSFSSAVTAELGSISNVTVGVTGDALATRTVNSPTATALGTYHAGAAVNVASNSFGYTYGSGGTGAHADTEDTTVQAYGGAADANGITLSGLANNVSSAATFTRSFNGTAAVNSSSGSFNLTVNPELSSATSVNAAYTIGVYSGQMIWNGGNGTYATGSNWTDSVTGGAQVAPGLDGSFVGVDSATFNGAGGTVSLSGATPSLNQLTFNNNGSYTIDQNSSGGITMAGSASSINVTGSHTISAPVTLADNDTTVDVSSSNMLTATGGINGIKGLVKTGVGTLDIQNANSYSGTTTVSGGALLVNGTNSGSGAYTVNNGGTLGGAGTISTANVMLASTGAKLSAGNAIGAIGTLTLTSGNLDISTGINGNSGDLVFDLNSTGPGGSDLVALTNGTLTIGTGVLGFNDFVFNTSGSFGPGVYTLFDTNHTITGTLGANLTGTFGALTGIISFSNANQDIILTVTAVPEPATYGALAGLALSGLSLTSVIRCRKTVRK